MSIHKASLNGTAAASSSGIAIGRVQKLAGGELAISECHIKACDIEQEVLRFEQALMTSVADFDSERLHLLDLESQEPLHILDAQRLMILDPDLSAKVVDSIRHQAINAEWAVHQQVMTIAEVFDHISDDYLRARKSDIEHVGQRILRHLSGYKDALLSLPDDEKLIVASEDLTPIEVIRLWRQGVAAFIAEKGGPNAHSIIIARGLGMPALIGAENMLRKIKDGDRLIIDGERGLWLVNPSPDHEAEYLAMAHDFDEEQRIVSTYAKRASLSRNGHPLKLMANLEIEDELPQARKLGAEGIGLYRTEFLLSDAEHLPDEDMQYQLYMRVMQSMDNVPVTFRLMDIGGEKPLLFEHIVGHRILADNPSLGLRGVRLLLRNKAVLRTQLRALLRASTDGDLRILVPMVSRVEEMDEVRAQLRACAADLGIPDVPLLGAMIEIPAAVIIADQLAAASDFFSIGTNDLIQYTLAADRSDEEVAYLYDTTHPALEPMLRQTAQAAKAAGIEVGMCGELASDLGWTETLMNMGFDSLSMSLQHILPIRKHLASLHYQA
ncbi:MAG: phosphoenolpyruvate--protein phosphotransferase [Mariprofundaceae bacterium]